jgi:hypothetical protein
MDRGAFIKGIDTVGGGRARDAFRPVQNVIPSAQSKLVADPDDLVARALEILAADNMMSDKPRFPRGANIAGDLGTQSGDLTLQRRVLSDGTECSLPIRYFDVQCLVATFLTELDRAAEVLMAPACKRFRRRMERRWWCSTVSSTARQISGRTMKLA